MFSEVMRYILDLGPTVMLPIVIIIFSKILGMKAGDCFKAGLVIGRMCFINHSGVFYPLRQRLRFLRLIMDNIAVIKFHTRLHHDGNHTC